MLYVVFIHFAFQSLLPRVDVIKELEFVAVGGSGDFDTWRQSQFVLLRLSFFGHLCNPSAQKNTCFIVGTQYILVE